MRIAVVANTAWYLYKFRGNLMTALIDAGHEVVAISPAGPDTTKIESLGVTHRALDLSGAGLNPLKELHSIRHLTQILRAEKIEAVLSNTPKGNLYSGLACCRLKGLKFIPNVSGLGRSFIHRNWVTRIVSLLYRLTFAQASAVLFQNQTDLQDFIARGWVRPEQARRVPGSGVDLTRFQPAPLVERPGGEVVFLLCARLLWDKGVGEYVEAARQLRQSHPQARCELLGYVDVDNPSAVSQAQVQAWVDEGIITYWGSTDDVRPYMTQADCIVLPSYREGMPRTLLEAAALSRPVITTDAPGCRDAVLDGQTGWMCKTADAKDLLRVMQNFAKLSLQQRLHFGQQARQDMEQRFDEKIVIQIYLKTVLN